MAFLQVQLSDGKVKKFELPNVRPVVIGRADGVDLVVPDSQASRRHEFNALVRRCRQLSTTNRFLTQTIKNTGV